MKKSILTSFLVFFMLWDMYPSEYRVILSSGPNTLEPTEFQAQVSLVVSSILQKYHYRRVQINDSLSSVVFDSYLSSLDGNKMYFLESDIKNFERYRTTFDDAFLSGNLNLAFEIYNTFYNRFVIRNNYCLQLVTKTFDFRRNEFLELDREDKNWAVTEEDLNDLWRKNVKSQYLSLKLAGKEDEEIRKTLKERYERYAKTQEQVNSDDVFQIYMNIFSLAFDPHTNYFLPITSENFMIGMSQSLEGIGARLQNENEYTKVVEVIPGGPAFKSRLVNQNDRIVGVAQGKDGEWVDVIGWRIDEVVQLIRGPKDTMVRLQLLKADTPGNSIPVEIVLIRDKVKIEEQAPQKEVMTLYRNNKAYRIGLITIPSFYLDFEGARAGDPDFKSTTRDVLKLINELKTEKIDGILLDLRNNGGGSLAEAISLTGLFIPDGPVVQIKNSMGNIEVQKDEDKNLYYEGPLGILINKFSASASEIFSGAIQDYKRGVIIGETSYGKGTVQNLLDLDRFLINADEKPGQVKLTLAKFYRVTGSSTQHKGVTPDILLPSPFSAEEYGESAEPSALPWDFISASRFQKLNYLDSGILKELSRNHLRRMEEDPDLIELKNDVEKLKSLAEKKTISINYDQRLKEQEEEEKLNNSRLQMIGNIPSNDIPTNNKDTEIRDPYLKEGLNVLIDWLSYRIG